MGILNGLAGNMQQLDPQQAMNEYGPWLLQGEQVQAAFRTVRDGFAMTNFRIISIDRQGATGKKTRVTSIPLNSIVEVTAETAGAGVDDSELTLVYIRTPQLRGHNLEMSSIRFEFPKSFDLPALYRHLMGIAQSNLQFINQA